MDRPAQFSRQTVRLQFPKEIHFGDDITIWISRTGDLAQHMYLKIDWPADAPTTVQPSCGTAMIDRVELLYKDQVIERIYGENLFMIGDVTVPQAKQGALSNLVGKNLTSNLSSYYIELPFGVMEKGLPLLALDEPPRLRIILNSSTKFTSSVYTRGLGASLFVDYVYISGPERNWFLNNELLYVTRNWQRLDFQVPVTDSQKTYTFYTNFVNDVKEIFWVIQSSAASNVYDYGTTDHLVNLRLVLNGQERITNDYGTPLYLRSLQGLQYHTRIPDGRYYMYSFALTPEESMPTGEINMSMITRQQHDLTLTSHAYSRNVRMYALSYNVLKIKEGAAQMLYTIQEAAPPQFSGVDPPPPPPLPPPPPGTATGGTETTYSLEGTTYKVHTFTSSGTFTVSGGSLTCSFLIVGGGGGGGLGNIELLFGAGGGGAGGLIYSASTIFQPASYAVGVGDGGDGSSSVELSGSTGGSSYIIGILEGVYGGGGGSGSLETTFPGNGGCGGGGIYYGGGNEPLQGNAGGSGDALIGAGGGGGGAGVAGGDGVTYMGGIGGDGLAYSISGELQYYAGGGGGIGVSSGGGLATLYGGHGGQGGGGSGDPFSMFGPNAIVNTGGGGGAAEYGYYPGVGGNGGSGIVIISYPL